MRRTWRLRPSWIEIRSRLGRDQRRLGRRGDAVVELDALAQRAAARRATARPRPRRGTPSRRRSGGWVRRWVSSPSLVSSSSPSVSRSRRPTGNTRGLGRHQVDHGRPALGVGGGGDHARRLVEQVVDEPGVGDDRGRRRPRASRRRRRPGARASATSPLTVTRPSSISSSHARRLPTPARASTFWSFSGALVTRPSRLVGLVASAAGRRRLARRRAIGDRGRRAAGRARAPRRPRRPGTKSPSGGRSSMRVEAEPLEEQPAWCRTAWPGPGPGRGPTSSM